MKRIISIVLLASIALSSMASGEETVFFTDSAGRVVNLPSDITRVAVTGPMTQMVMFSIAPEKLVGLSVALDEASRVYLPERIRSLPVIGQYYGGGDMNLEALISTGAQIVLDIGEPKSTIVEDMDDLTEQTGIPFVHVSMSTSTMPEALRMLGALLGEQSRASDLADFCEDTYAMIKDIADSGTKTRALYITGAKGINVIAKGSYHADIIDMLCDNLAVIDSPTSRGTGNEVDMEQIMGWNPDVIFFSPESIYTTVGDDPLYQRVNAIKNGRYYKVPLGPFNWMGFPPSVQRVLGMLWMTKILYPEKANYDLYEKTAEYFELFYHITLTREQFDELVA